MKFGDVVVRKNTDKSVLNFTTSIPAGTIYIKPFRYSAALLSPKSFVQTLSEVKG
jgi:hypothetical protein